MLKSVLFLGLVLVCSVICAAENADNLEQVQLGSYEGSFSLSNHGFLHLCQDGNHVYGSFNDEGLLDGTIEDDNLNGRFYSAGKGPCVTGSFNFARTPYGLEGFYICNGLPGAISWTATRTSSFRPNDNQCATLSTTTNTLRGEWVNKDGWTVDLCFVNNQPSNAVTGSLQRQNSAGEVVSWYIEGNWTANGQIVQGTWYQNFEAGGILIYLSNNGEFTYFWWTGLLFKTGRTFIDINQLHDPALHGRDTYQAPPGNVAGGQSSSARCNSNAILKPLVLQNLQDDDDNYYYFVDTQELQNQDFKYVEFTPLNNNIGAGASLIASLSVLVGSLIVLFF